MLQSLTITSRLWISIASIAVITITICMIFEPQTIENITMKKVVEDNSEDICSDNSRDNEPEFESFTGRKTMEYTPYQEGFQEGLKSLEDVGRDLENIGRAIVHFFEALAKLKEMGEGIDELFRGIGQILANSGEAAGIVAVDIGNIIEKSFECGLQLMKNFRICIVWYILDMILHFFKAVLITFPIFVLKELTGYDLTWSVNYVYDEILVPLDDMINTACTVTSEGSCHIIHFPQWVIDDCYSCSVQEQVDKIQDDYNNTIPDLIQRPIDRIHEGGNKIAEIYNS